MLLLKSNGGESNIDRILIRRGNDEQVYMSQVWDKVRALAEIELPTASTKDVIKLLRPVCVI